MKSEEKRKLAKFAKALKNSHQPREAKVMAAIFPNLPCKTPDEHLDTFYRPHHDHVDPLRKDFKFLQDSHHSCKNRNSEKNILRPKCFFFPLLARFEGIIYN